MPQPLTAAELLEIARRNFDPNWLTILETEKAGQQILALYERVFERAARAIHRVLRRQTYLLDASGATPALATVNLSRTFEEAETYSTLFSTEGKEGDLLYFDGVPPAGLIPEGHPFTDERGILFITSDETIVGFGQTDVTIPQVESTRFSPQADTPDGFIGGVATFSPAATLFDPLLRVASATAAVGGSSPMLDELAEERNVFRAEGEGDEELRSRAARIEDAVAPIAMRDAVNFVADRYGFRVTLLEPFDDLTAAGGPLLTHTAVDSFAASETFPTSSQSALFAVFGPEQEVFSEMVDDFLGFFGTPPSVPIVLSVDVFFSNDPQSQVISVREAFAYFALVSPIQGDPDLLRLFTESGFADDPLLGFPDVLDHPQTLLKYLAIVREATARKAAGVQFDYFLTFLPDFPSP